MKKYYKNTSFRLLLFLILFFPIHAASSLPGNLSPSDFELMLNTQKQSLSWSIAGNALGENPNVLSELIWENLYGVGIELKPVWQLENNFTVSFSFNYCKIINGTVSDSDYEGDNRASRVFFVEMSASDGHTYRLYPNIGYEIRGLIPFLISLRSGYVCSSQLYYLKDETIIENGKSLNSTYHTLWHGPGFSLEAQYRNHRKTVVSIEVQYFQARYGASANWNLLEPVAHPVSFIHQAKGFGVECSFKFFYEINKTIELIFNLSSSYWSTGIGIDHLYKIDGSILHSRLNGVSYRDLSAKIGIRFSFQI